MPGTAVSISALSVSSSVSRSAGTPQRLVSCESVA